LRSARPPTVDIDLQIRFGQLKSRRTAVDHATERGTVTLAKTGYRENPAEGIARHP
jgi:hypothetical protein